MQDRYLQGSELRIPNVQRRAFRVLQPRRCLDSFASLFRLVYIGTGSLSLCPPKPAFRRILRNLFAGHLQGVAPAR